MHELLHEVSADTWAVMMIAASCPSLGSGLLPSAMRRTAERAAELQPYGKSQHVPTQLVMI